MYTMQCSVFIFIDYLADDSLRLAPLSVGIEMREWRKVVRKFEIIT